MKRLLIAAGLAAAALAAFAPAPAAAHDSCDYGYRRGSYGYYDRGYSSRDYRLDVRYYDGRVGVGFRYDSDRYCRPSYDRGYYRDSYYDRYDYRDRYYYRPRRDCYR